MLGVRGEQKVNLSAELLRCRGLWDDETAVWSVTLSLARSGCRDSAVLVAAWAAIGSTCFVKKKDINHGVFTFFLCDIIEILYKGPVYNKKDALGSVLEHENLRTNMKSAFTGC